MGAAIRSDIQVLVRGPHDSRTWRVLANAVATGVNLVEPARDALRDAIADLGEAPPAREPLARLGDVADSWLAAARRVLQSDRPVDELRALSPCDAVEAWERSDGRSVYRTLAARWPWPEARRLIDALLAADEIVLIATGVLADERLRDAATRRAS